MSSSLDKFLAQIDVDNIYVLPYNSNARKLAIQAINERRIERLTGKCLMKQNVNREALRLLPNQDKEDIINEATNYFWDLRPSQRCKFKNLANNANRIISFKNNTDTINRISRITEQQTNNSLANNFYNGTKFP